MLYEKGYKQLENDLMEQKVIFIEMFRKFIGGSVIIIINPTNPLITKFSILDGGSKARELERIV